MGAEVEHDQQPAAVVLALVGEDVSLDAARMVTADLEHRLVAAQRNQLAIEREERPGVVLLSSDVGFGCVARNRQPRVARRRAEAGVGGGVPLHWRALRIATNARVADTNTP